MTEIHADAPRREPDQKPDQQHRMAIFEALLFAEGAPLSIKPLADAAACTSEDAIISLHALARSLSGRGIMLIERNETYQLVTRPEYGTYMSSLKRRDLDGPLTQPQLETLAVIAYRGPARKSEVDYLRGVNSTFTLRNLLTRGLIDRMTPAADGDRAPQYQISSEFLNHLGLTAVRELPSYAEFHGNPSEPTVS